MKKIILLYVSTLFVLTTSCKKEAVSPVAGQIDENVVAPEATQTPAVSLEEAPTPPPADGKYPVFTFETIEHDFGTITQGDKVSYDFKFKNTGEADLIITDAKGSCGCTVPDYPKTPIKPGEDGIIKVSFDSTGKIGLNSKSVTLTCNIKEGKKIILIKANIEPSQKTK
ncbi:DUF1573 domain-containing protein [Flavobacterium sp. RSB2_4_14]|uniref:DUF1573 domain-containing protein n=1 Tax=Flavobacterium sp. RSB2_4_14 TaxID=3447665 RepID=UPI003F3BCCF3